MKRYETPLQELRFIIIIIIIIIVIAKEKQRQQRRVSFRVLVAAADQ